MAKEDSYDTPARSALALGSACIGSFLACLGAYTYFSLHNHTSLGAWLILLGGGGAAWGVLTLRSLRPAPQNSDTDFLRSAFRDGQDPESLHTPEQLRHIRNDLATRHQKKVLWSLPFWLCTLWILIVNEGRLGGATALGISNLWLVGLTLGAYFLHAFTFWRCPACDAPLPKYHPRLCCDKCGLELVKKESTAPEPGFPSGAADRPL